MWLFCEQMSHMEYMGLIATKPVIGVSDQVMQKPACSATKTIARIVKVSTKQVLISYFPISE